MDMFTVMKREAVSELLGHEFKNVKLEEECIDIENALGRILAEDIIARENIPDFVRSTVDGYAVKSQNTVGANQALPAFLNLVGEVKMGEETDLCLGEHETAYVPTGGMLPKGADSMVMIEYTDVFGDEIAINKPAANLENVIGVGDDVARGWCALNKGLQIKTQHIGALAALGYSKVKVRRRPRITILSTGDELVAVDQKPAVGQIRDVNTYSLQAMVTAIGCQVVGIKRLKDDFEHLKDALKTAQENSDVVFLSGGSSVGNHDMTSEVINAVGTPGVLVHGIAIKPGKPTIAARIDKTAIFGLPGHPASCVIAFKAVVEPFIQEVLLGAEIKTQRIEAVSGFQMHVSSGRDVFFMVTLDNRNDQITAQPVKGKSGMVSMFSSADGYIEIPMEKEGLEIGEKITVTLFR